MASTLAPTPTTEDRIHVPVWAWFLAAFSVFAVYLVSLENGAVLGHLAENTHEFFHDARHFIGFPCH